MKKILLILSLIYVFSCKKEHKTFDKNQSSESVAISGEEIFNQNNCTACHKTDQKVVGPSLQEIAKIYKEKNGNLISFLKEEAEPIVDSSQYEIMKVNLQVTKKMNDAELTFLAKYILQN